MAGRTQEQIEKMIGGINRSLPYIGNSDDEKLLQGAMVDSVLSEGFRLGIGSAIKRARWQGVLDGIKYATGKGELPDIEKGLRGREIMAKYLSPDVMRAVLGPRIDPQEGSGNNG